MSKLCYTKETPPPRSGNPHSGRSSMYGPNCTSYIRICILRVFPARLWPKPHVWIGVCFGGMFRGMFQGTFRGMFRSSGLLTKSTLWGYVSRYVSGYLSEGSKHAPFHDS